MKKAFEILGQVTLAVVIGSVLAVMFIEWMAGCGESYVDAKGVTHANECIIIPHNK
jgi:mannose/fructose/N-acetylgalactosamine-specific phosphotransferase system component IIC